MVLKLEDIKFIVEKMQEIIIQNEVPFCELDSVAGDGDFGMSVAKGFKQLKKEKSETDEETTIKGYLRAVSMVILEHCGGASGPIWGSAFRGAAKAVGSAESIDLVLLDEVLKETVKAIQKTGERSFGRGAVVGDKTLIDALIPCSESISDSLSKGIDMQKALPIAAQAAVKGAESTKEIGAKMGRAANVGERSIGHPDAGAFAVGLIFTQVVEALQSR